MTEEQAKELVAGRARNWRWGLWGTAFADEMEPGFSDYPRMAEATRLFRRNPDFLLEHG